MNKGEKAFAIHNASNCSGVIRTERGWAGRHHLLWLEEQLTISGVVKSLPVNREFALKVREELIEKHYKDDPNKNTFGLAFITCYDWLAKLCTK